MDDIKCDESDVESVYIDTALKLMCQQSKVRSETTIQTEWTAEMKTLLPDYTVKSRQWSEAANAKSDISVSSGLEW